MESSRYEIVNIDKKYEGLRLDKFLFSVFKNVNNVLIQKALRNKDILVNGKTVKNNQPLYSDDELMLSKFILKIFNSPPKIVKSKKELKFTDNEINKIKSHIIYRDDYILGINKPSGLAVQSGTKIEKSLNDFLPYLKFDKLEAPKLVHRIDKDTSGALILARDKKTSEILAEYFKDKDEKLEKIYLTVVVGKFNKDEGKINFPLLKKVENGVEKVYRDETDGKEAVTLYKVLGYSEKYGVSLLEVKILTGRTHQIRVHMKEIGHPILGDGKYGGKKAFVEGLGDRLHLHSYRINIKDLYGKNTNIKAEPPDNFQKTLKKLKNDFHNLKSFFK